MRASLLVGVAYYAAAGDAETAYGMSLVAATAIAVRFIGAPPLVELAFIALLALDSWLTATGAMSSISADDHGGHLVLSAALVPVIAALICRVRAAAGQHVAALSALAGFAVVFTGVVWELIELSSDALFNTNMRLGAGDTYGDLAADVAGAILGACATFVCLRSSRTVAGEPSPELRPK